MRLALDTNRYSDMCHGDASTVAKVEQAAEVFVPLIVLGELRAGFGVGRRGVENERVLFRFLQRPGVQVVSPDEETTHRYAAIYGQLRQQGTPMPTNDMWIAALVLQHDMVLLTRDRHFDFLVQIRRA
jgi:tRNA(fMet)-specific endonuclease VapC